MTSVTFQEAMATLDLLETLLGRVAPLVAGIERTDAREAIRAKMARAKLELDAARCSALLLGGILPV